MCLFAISLFKIAITNLSSSSCFKSAITTSTTIDFIPENTFYLYLKLLFLDLILFNHNFRFCYFFIFHESRIKFTYLVIFCKWSILVLHQLELVFFLFFFIHESFALPTCCRKLSYILNYERCCLLSIWNLPFVLLLWNEERNNVLAIFTFWSFHRLRFFLFFNI